MLIREEVLADTWDEMVPLCEAHYDEVAHFKDIPLNIDFETYNKREELGGLKFFTVRKDSDLVGYAIYFIAWNMHYKSSKQAVQDVLFLLPEHRRSGVGRELIEFADAELKKCGVDAVYHHVKVKPSLDFGVLLERIGYELVDKIYARRL